MAVPCDKTQLLIVVQMLGKFLPTMSGKCKETHSVDDVGQEKCLYLEIRISIFTRFT